MTFILRRPIPRIRPLALFAGGAILLALAGCTGNGTSGGMSDDMQLTAEEAAATSKESELHGLHERLVAMLRGVVTDLDRDRVSQGEFEHFSFTWDAVDTLVRDRMTRVAKEPRDG